MISRIRGTLLRRELDSAEVMTQGGVAYQVSIPLSVFEALPPEGSDVELITYQVVREDSIELFGFLHDGDRRLFARLLTASGVGPRLALSMLSTLPPQRLVRAIVDKDIAALRQVPGLGVKKAEKLAVELADRLDDLAVAVAGTRAEGRTAEDAVGALVALGYSHSEATEAVRAALDADGRIQGVELIRAALAAMSRA
ncbi:MAG: Holliday junction branch migration protein RuvA [Candidatus Cloacimonetes bacterium]|nr:Holliday junction branch migration protein RuvA [Candidatus Cloacimonadota bacterium]